MPKPQWTKRYTDSWASFPTPIRRILAASVGLVTLVVGVLRLVLPGPGLVVMLLGLAILATEFAWAKRSMHQVKQQGNRFARGIMRQKKQETDEDEITPNDEESNK